MFRALVVLIYPDYSFGLYSSLLKTSPFNPYGINKGPDEYFSRELKYFFKYRNHYKKVSKRHPIIPKNFFTDDKYLIDPDKFNKVFIPLKKKFICFKSTYSECEKLCIVIKFYESGEIEYSSEEIKKIERK